MGNKNGRRGGGKKNQPGGREGNAMAKTNKSANSNSFDEHLAQKERLRRDGEKQRLEHIRRARRKRGQPTEKVDAITILDGETAVKKLPDEDADRNLLLIDDHSLIVGLRTYERNPDGSPVGRTVTSDEFVATHRRVRRERERYRELDGTLVSVGEVVRKRKGRDMETLTSKMELRDDLRRAPCVLKSIMVRLMPHEAEIAGGELKGKSLDAAMDRVVTEYAAATGCEVISAAVHRMSGKDLHIHIQYTLVIGGVESKSMLGRRLVPWKRMAAEMARAALMQEGVENPNPSAIGAMKKRLIADEKLDPAPVAGIEYRKIKGRRSLRDDAILGYSFRMKLNLVRLAEDAGDPALGNRVIARNDERKRFRPIARREDADLERQYLDLWLERAWRNSVKAELPEEALERIRVAGVDAAKDYAELGTVMVEEFHIKRRKLELRKEADEIELAAQYAAAYEAELFRREVEDEALRRGEAMNREFYEASIRDLEFELQGAREAAQKDRTAAEERVSELEDRQAELESKETELVKSATAALAVGDQAKREAELAIERAQESALRQVEQAELDAKKHALEKEAAEAASRAKESGLHHALETARVENQAAQARIAELETQRTELEASVTATREAIATKTDQAESYAKRAEKTIREEKARTAEVMEDLKKTVEETSQILDMFQKVLDVPGVARLLLTFKMVRAILLPFCEKVGLKLEVPSPNQKNASDPELPGNAPPSSP
jgi:hypothetical protein